jgi:4-hydroxy-tetrahydrodipicolinate synthase
MRTFWQGVIPAVATPFKPDMTIDEEHFSEQCRRLLAAGCRGVLAAGSTGEASTLTFAEKVRLFELAVEATSDRGVVIAGITGPSTAEAVELARAAQVAGCQGLLVPPPYVYTGSWRELRAHLSSVFRATNLPAMLYNNPALYGADLSPAQVGVLAEEHPTLQAIKESTGDVRRVTALRTLLGERLAIFAGLDDIVVESVRAGATGWIAVLANVFPEASVRLFDLAVDPSPEQRDELELLYQAFLPTLRLDTVPDYIQRVKLAMELVGHGPARLRPPRLELEPAERDAVQVVIEEARGSLGKPAMVAAR